MEFIQNLLVALDDPKIKNKIRSIKKESIIPSDEQDVFNTQNSAQRDEPEQPFVNLNLQRELENKTSQISQLKAKQIEQQSELKQKETTLNEYRVKERALDAKLSELKQKSRELAFYKDTFTPDVSIHGLYVSLSEETKTSLSGIFKSISVQGLIVCGCQEINIMNLWDYLKNVTIDSPNKDLEKVTKLFELLFDRFTLAYPMYSLQSTSEGDEFDTQAHIRHNASANMNGAIQKVLLTGIENNKTGRVIKQSIVIV